MTRRGLLGLSSMLAGCGYHVGGKSDLLPKTIQTIAIPAFTNLTARYKFSDRLAGAITVTVEKACLRMVSSTWALWATRAWSFSENACLSSTV